MRISWRMVLTLVATKIINEYIKQNDKDEDLLLPMMILTLISLTGHVQHPDDGVRVVPVGPRRHQTLVPVVVGHGADRERLLHVKIQLVPLLDQVVVVGGSVVVPGAVIVVSDMIRVFIVRTVGTSETFPVDVVHNISVCL